MKKQTNNLTNRIAAIAGAIGVLLVSVWILSLPQATASAPDPPPALPPTLVPTPTSAPKPTSPPATGGLIELQVQFPKAWPWDDTHWQELWTVVQWLDDKGVWRTVEGWQGTLNDIAIGEDGTVTGYKTWWAASDYLGKGPFRWIVYDSQGGATLAMSEFFYLPDTSNETVKVEVSLSP